MRKPISGIYLHEGEVVRGIPKVGDEAIASIDAQRRHDIMRNHTATHLLHAELRTVLGDHARQAGSLVAPDRLRFDFTHPEPVTKEQLDQIEAGINRNILGNYRLNITYKPLHMAISEGATALFGEKYTETVRTITIGAEEPFSYELCGGTHVEETGDIGICLITSEGSVASGIRRIEAVTGRKAYELVHQRFNLLSQAADLLSATPNQIPEKIISLQNELSTERKQMASLRKNLVAIDFQQALEEMHHDTSIKLLVRNLPSADPDTLRQLADRFRQRYPQNGVLVLGSVVDQRPIVIAAVTDDLVARGIHAGELVKAVALPLGGGGGGKPTIAQAGGKDASKLDEALSQVENWVKEKLSIT
jgi:alanyl-tRNA synthetase